MPYTDPNNPSMDTWYDDPSTATGPYGTGGGTPQQAATRDQIIAWYQQYLGRTPSDAEIQSHSGNPAGAAGVQDAIQNGQEGKAYASRPEPTTNQTTPTNPTNPTNPTTPTSGTPSPVQVPWSGNTTTQDNTGAFGGQLTNIFTGTPPSLDLAHANNIGGPAGTAAVPNVGNAPAFTAPAFKQAPAFTYDDFKAPSYQDAASDPGYQFALGEGAKAMEQSAAARGVLNTGGTLKDLLNYGQSAAAQQYGNVYNRQADTYKTNRSNAATNYMTNYQTQYTDPYNYAFQGAAAEYAPKLAGYQNQVQADLTGYTTQSQANQRLNENNYLNAWNQFLNSQNQWASNQDRAYQKLYQNAVA